MAARNYEPCLQADCELRELVVALRGGIDLTDEELEANDHDLDKYLGCQLDLEIVHGKKNAKHDYPFVIIQKVFPAGTLVKQATEPVEKPLSIPEAPNTEFKKAA